MSYPVRRDDLFKHAKAEGADRALCEQLGKLPGDSFETPADVSKAIGAANG